MYITYKHVAYNVYYIIWKLSLKRTYRSCKIFSERALKNQSKFVFFHFFFYYPESRVYRKIFLAYQKNRTGLDVKIFVNVIISKHFFRVTCVYYLILYKRNKVGVLPRRRMIYLIITASASKIKITRSIPTFFFLIKTKLSLYFYKFTFLCRELVR